jgi:hypothetical protein
MPGVADSSPVRRVRQVKALTNCLLDAENGFVILENVTIQLLEKVSLR